MFPSHVHSKSTDWFLYDGIIGSERINLSILQRFSICPC